MKRAAYTCRVWPITNDVTRYEEASAYLQRRVPMLKKDWLALTDEARVRGFTVAGVAQLSVIQDTLDALDKAVSEGEGLADFKARMGAKLAQEWGGANPRRLELIYQNGIQHAYNAGRYKTATDPEVLEMRPYWQFDAILDNRTTPVCKAADGTILSHDHDWWQTHYPPLHHACRSSVRSLSRSAAKREGLTEEADLTDHAAGTGFGHLPDVEPWAPDPADFEADLFQAFEVVAVPPPVTGADMRARLEFVGKDYEAQLATAKAEEKASRDAYMAAVQDRTTPKDVRDRLGTIWEGKADTLAKYRTGTMRPDYAEVMAAPTPGSYTGAYAKTLAAQEKDGARAAVAWVNTVVGKLPDQKAEGLTVPFFKDGRKVNGRSHALDRRTRGRYYRADDKKKAGVYLDSRSPASVSVHELGHWLEGESDSLHAAALKFLDRRRGNEKLQWVGCGRKSEVGWHDQFISKYMGKDYTVRGDRYASEIVSMGLQLMYEDALAFARADPDYFDAIFHMLRGLPYD